jgi:hypothetical protein
MFKQLSNCLFAACYFLISFQVRFFIAEFKFFDHFINIELEGRLSEMFLALFGIIETQTLKEKNQFSRVHVSPFEFTQHASEVKHLS